MPVADVVTSRSGLESSLNFRLPPSWTAGLVTLRLQVPGDLTCDDALGADAASAATVDFVPTGGPEIDFLAVRYDEGSTRREPSDAVLIEQVLRTRDILSVAQLRSPRIRTLGHGFSGAPDLPRVNSRLETRRWLDRCFSLFGCDRLYYGVLEGSGGGLANSIPGTVSSGYLSGTGARNAHGYARNRGSHEIAHTMGYGHTVNVVENGTETRGIWPFRTEYKRGFWAQSLRGAGVSASSAAGHAEDPVDYLLVRGIVDFTDPDASSFDPFLPLTAPGRLPDAPGGRWRVVLFDAEGRELASRDFEPIEFETDEPQGGGDGSPGRGMFLVPFEADGTLLVHVARAELHHDDIDGPPLAIVEASEEAATVAIRRPTLGERADGDGLTVTWDAEGAPDTALVASVQYRTGHDAEWETLAVDLDGSSLTVPRAQLAGSGAAQVRLIVSDGMRFGEDVSEPFEVASSAPLLAISAPEQDAEHYGIQQVVFEGAALDAEDGHLGDAIAWTSDVDGELGTGEVVLRRADELTEGWHTITATVADSGGRTSTASVRILVARGLPLGEPGPGDPQAIADCMEGGWRDYGFRNQGLCVRFVNTGRDSRW